MVPRFTYVDQFGDQVDIYDFANQGHPVAIQLVTLWAAPALTMSNWMAGQQPNLFGLYNGSIPLHVAAGDIYWVTVIYEDVLGQPVSAQDCADFYVSYPVGGPVLCPATDELPQWFSLAAIPGLALLEEDLTIAIYNANGWNPAMDEIQIRYP